MMTGVKPLVFLFIFGIHLTFNEVQAGMNKECMNAMQTMMEKQVKLLVPCIESLGLTTGAEKKEKALFFLPVPFILRGIFHVDRKVDRLKEVLTYFLQCVMKCVMVKAEMLAPDGTVDMDLAQKAMENLPDALKEKASDVISECGHHAASLEPGEASCESYREFIGCMLDVALKMCVE